MMQENATLYCESFAFFQQFWSWSLYSAYTYKWQKNKAVLRQISEQESSRYLNVPHDTCPEGSCNVSKPKSFRDTVFDSTQHT